jgi:hypothetical protein
MSIRGVYAALLMSSAVLSAQVGGLGPATTQAQTTFPIVFTRTVGADSSHAGAVVLAKTEQEVRLSNGTVIPAGATVSGHVVAANGFVRDSTPYAHQAPSALSIRFDSIQIAGKPMPLDVTVRAMADPATSWGAREPRPYDPLATVTQVGGDQLIPSQAEVHNRNGEIVAYNKRGGVYAHLISNGRCDGGDVEVPVGIYSASACGLYGFTDVSATEFGSVSAPSTITLVSSKSSPKILKHSTALLEVLPAQQGVASR